MKGPVCVWLCGTAGALRAALHNGTGPMDRTMSGRHTPGLEYKHEPLHKTRSELLEARKKMGAVNMAYDLDGDGSVGAPVL